RPRNVTTAPSDPAVPSACPLAASTSRPSSSGAPPIASSGTILSVYGGRQIWSSGSPEMVQRPVPLADRERVPDRAADVILRAGDGVDQRKAQREVRRDGGRERAAGPVRMRRGDPHRLQLGEEHAVE